MLKNLSLYKNITVFRKPGGKSFRSSPPPPYLSTRLFTCEIYNDVIPTHPVGTSGLWGYTAKRYFRLISGQLTPELNIRCHTV